MIYMVRQGNQRSSNSFSRLSRMTNVKRTSRTSKSLDVRCPFCGVGRQSVDVRQSCCRVLRSVQRATDLARLVTHSRLGRRLVLRHARQSLDLSRWRVLSRRPQARSVTRRVSPNRSRMTLLVEFGASPLRACRASPPVVGGGFSSSAPLARFMTGIRPSATLRPIGRM